MSRTGLIADVLRRRRSIIISLHESDLLPVDFPELECIFLLIYINIIGN